MVFLVYRCVVFFLLSVHMSCKRNSYLIEEPILMIAVTVYDLRRCMIEDNPIVRKYSRMIIQWR